jgi:hypothetical protein
VDEKPNLTAPFSTDLHDKQQLPRTWLRRDFFAFIAWVAIHHWRDDTLKVLLANSIGSCLESAELDNTPQEVYNLYVRQVVTSPSVLVMKATPAV